MMMHFLTSEKTSGLHGNTEPVRPEHRDEDTFECVNDLEHTDPTNVTHKHHFLDVGFPGDGGKETDEKGQMRLARGIEVLIEAHTADALCINVVEDHFPLISLLPVSTLDATRRTPHSKQHRCAPTVPYRDNQVFEPMTIHFRHTNRRKNGVGRGGDA